MKIDLTQELMDWKDKKCVIWIIDIYKKMFNVCKKRFSAFISFLRYRLSKTFKRYNSLPYFANFTFSESMYARVYI